jgi:hypothetical protein
MLNKKNGRIPPEILRGMARSLNVNNRFLPGEKLEFYVTGRTVKIIILYRFRRVLNNMSDQGTSGIEVTIKDCRNNSRQTCISPVNSTQMCISEQFELPDEWAQVSINLPPFAIVDSVLINKRNFAGEFAGTSNSIAVYGSSVTHGCAASRPALSYTCLLEKLTGCKVLNFGFSESAKGELDVIGYIASLGEKIIILEYDHNAAVHELSNSHWNVYKKIRSITDCWIIFMSRFSGGLSITEEEEQERIRIISDTFHRAVESGDEHVALILGNTLIKNNKEPYFVDGVHPNDMGMKLIAETIYETIQKRGMLN